MNIWIVLLFYIYDDVFANDRQSRLNFNNRQSGYTHAYFGV